MSAQQNFKLLELIPAKQRTSSVTGSDVDLSGYVNPGGRNMKAFLTVGAAASGTTLDVKIQEGDTTASYTDISAAAFTQVTTTPGNQEIHFRTNKRYVRAIATITGTSYDFSAVLLVEKRTT